MNYFNFIHIELNNYNDDFPYNQNINKENQLIKKKDIDGIFNL